MFITSASSLADLEFELGLVSLHSFASRLLGFKLKTPNLTPQKSGVERQLDSALCCRMAGERRSTLASLRCLDRRGLVSRCHGHNWGLSRVFFMREVHGGVRAEITGIYGMYITWLKPL